jgi:hypothetical protein
VGECRRAKPKETMVAMDEMTAEPEAGAKTGMRRWNASGPTRNSPPPAGGAVYGLGMIGALVYFMGTAESRWDYVLAAGKATVWPALLVYRAFKRLGD